MKNIILIILFSNTVLFSDNWKELSSALFPYAKGMGCELEITTLAELQSKYGKTKIYEDGDASEYSKRITYYVSIESTFVTFDVTEVGGQTTVMLFSLQKNIKDTEFRTLSSIRFTQSDFNGIRLGMTKSAFANLFGKEAKIDANSVTFSTYFSAPIISDACKSAKLPEDVKIESCDPSISIYGEFENDRLVTFMVFKFTTI